MKKTFAFLILLLSLALAPASRAQFIGYTSPQTVTATVFNAVAAPAASGVLQNVGQSVHYLTYTTSSSAAILRIRIEGSNDGTNFFPISDDATDPVSGGIFAFGYFSAVRINLLTLSLGTLTANYAGTSVTAGGPAGVFNSSQTSRKIIFSNGNPQASTDVDFGPPYGNTAGWIYVSASGTLGPNCQLAVKPIDGPTIAVQNVLSFTGAQLNSTFSQFQIPAFPANRVRVSWTACGGAQATFNVTYFFYPVTTTPIGVGSGTVQGLLQPVSPTAAGGSLNSENVSAVNTAVTKSIAALQSQRAILFSVSARCSAGTASLTVKDGVGGTTIWTSAGTEVGTTTFRYQWSPGLASSVSNGMDITLSTCGAGNTGTLDVQASQQ